MCQVHFHTTTVSTYRMQGAVLQRQQLWLRQGHSSEGPGHWPICIKSTAKAYAAPLLLPPTSFPSFWCLFFL